MDGSETASPPSTDPVPPDLFEASLDALPSQVCLLDDQGRIVWVNRAWERFGQAGGLPDSYAPVGQDYLKVAEAEAPEVCAGIQGVLDGQRDVLETEYPCHAPDRERWFRMRVTPVSGDTEAAAIVVHDEITEVRAEHHALEDARRTLELLAENLDPLLWIVSADLEEMIFTSPEADAFWGLPEGTLEEEVMAWTARVHPDDRDRVLDRIQADLEELLQGRDPEGTYVFRLATDGQAPARWIQLKTGPVHGPDGTLEAVVGITEDISQAKRAEQALAESERRFRQLADNVEDIFWVADAETGTVEYINPAFERWTGVPREAVYQDLEAWLTTIHPDDRERVIQPIAGEGSEVPRRLRLRMGEPGTWSIEALVQSRPVDAPDGQPVRIVGVVHDITDALRVAQAQAERARLEARQEELEQLTWVTSHDLVTPIRQIRSFSQLLQRQAGDQLDEDGQASLGYILEGAAKLDSLVGNLRRYAEIVTGDGDRSAMPLDTLWVQAIEPLEQALADAETIIEHGSFPVVEVDDEQVIQLLRELVTNALRFRRPGVPLKLSLTFERIGERWQIDLADNGQGFDPAYSEKVFGIFQQLDPAAGDEGAGLGLTICRRIAEAHGGRIWATAEPGAGATFSVTLPAPSRPGDG